MPLATLAWHPKVKINGDIWVYYNPDPGKITHSVLFSGGIVHTVQRRRCGTYPDGEDSVAEGGQIVATVVATPNSVVAGDIPADAPPGFAVEAETDPTGEGDFFYRVALPDPTNDVFLCFDQGFSSKPSNKFRPIPNKLSEIDHYVNQRGENTLTVSDQFVSNWRGLQKIAGRPCTIIVKITPNGTGVFSELQYYCNVILNPAPMNAGADFNEPIAISMDGTYDFNAIFSAPGPSGY